MMNPLVAVIVPVYNRHLLVGETIQSVMDQTYQNWELILVDDGSTDESFNTCTYYSQKDKRIRVFHRQSEKKGASVCRNEGIQYAQAAYIVFLDSDDLMASYCLEQRVNLLNQKPNLDFAVFPMMLFKERINDLMILQNTDTGEDTLDRFLNRDMVWVISGPIWKKSALLSIGGLKEDLPSFQDMELNVKALCAGLTYEIFLDRIPDTFYRQDRNNPISYKRDEPEHYKAHVKLIEHLVFLLDSGKQLNEKRKVLLANFLLTIATNWRYHLVNKDYNCMEQAMHTWKKALELGLVSNNQFNKGKNYIAFKFNMRYNRVKWLQRMIENNYQFKKIPELMWRRGTTQSKIKYTGNLVFPDAI